MTATHLCKKNLNNTFWIFLHCFGQFLNLFSVIENLDYLINYNWIMKYIKYNLNLPLLFLHSVFSHVSYSPPRYVNYANSEFSMPLSTSLLWQVCKGLCLHPSLLPPLTPTICSSLDPFLPLSSISLILIFYIKHERKKYFKRNYSL